LILLVVHIAAAAVAFGAPLGIGRLLKGAAAIDAQTLKLVVADAAKRTFLARVSAVTSLFSGVALIFVRGGFAAVSKNYHTALLVMWVLIGVQFFITRPAVRSAAEAANAIPLDRDAISKSAGKLGMAMGLGHALWVAILILMFQPF
jgi:hypothetical protein